jgi:hypothetical protein
LLSISGNRQIERQHDYQRKMQAETSRDERERTRELAIDLGYDPSIIEAMEQDMNKTLAEGDGKLHDMPEGSVDQGRITDKGLREILLRYYKAGGSVGKVQ